MLDVSEGESRRIRLARVLDARESGLCLLLDEPARGLHEADLPRLTLALERLRGEHTVILNEHRERLWEAADWLVEVGPHAGAAGGEIVYAGSPRGHVSADDEALRTARPITADAPNVAIRGASIHNVQSVDCEIPLGRLTCISGVSGSGKSSFVRGVLAPALLESLGGEAPDFELREGRWRSVGGAGSIREVVALDQAMPPPNRRSLVATYTGVFDGIRKSFGSSGAAKRDGLSASDFGVNGGEGRCTACLGVGEVADGDIWSPCHTCGGSRYGRAALAVRIAGVNVQELLETPVEGLCDRADTFHVPQRLINAMCDLGIGYVALGRRIDTLSGGEVQRLRLAMRLGAVQTGGMFFILDEPAVGLHPRDVRRLALALERVLDDGRNTIVIVEHDLRLIRSADWVVEFGPGSGAEGGQIIFAGSPGQLAKATTPTGLALAGQLPAYKRSAREAAAPDGRLPVSEQVARTAGLLRTLISGEATETLPSDEGSAEPIVMVTDRFWLEREEWEIAGLDHEIPKLLLDVQRPAREEVFAEFLAAWRNAPDCWLAIHPFLAEMQTWGTELPRSAIRAVSGHLAKEGLRLVERPGQDHRIDFDVRTVRARGERLVPDGNTAEARLRALRDAFAIGARYVELWDLHGELAATATDRLLDLDAGIVAPTTVVPSHFSRHDPRGRCPACAGRRTVKVAAEPLVIASGEAAPDGEGFLTPEADAVMKGVRRNELKPFLRRLAAEGLWDASTPFRELSLERRSVILFGFWSRPGAGSFLKSPSADPAEVGSWLRWDGLYGRLLGEVSRSRNAEWASRLKNSVQAVRCPTCDGSGLQPFAKLLRVGEMNFSEWAVLDAPDRRLKTLRGVAAHTPRQRQTQRRILDCLAPLAGSSTAGRVAVVERAVESFTTMEAVNPSDGIRS
ncbi:MAG TPA: hypothetical protein VE913_17165 [Longimicrobium sp.]|nr:hypothetical protein [Longimicrobium sp.]